VCSKIKLEKPFEGLHSFFPAPIVLSQKRGGRFGKGVQVPYERESLEDCDQSQDLKRASHKRELDLSEKSRTFQSTNQVPVKRQDPR